MLSSLLLAFGGLAVFSDAVYIQYSTIPGYFLQDLNSTNSTTFDYTSTNFGLINRTYDADPLPMGMDLTQWERFERQVAMLNRQAPINATYKVLMIGRHGDGFHNDAQTFYGTPAWNCYYSLIDGNATNTWGPDADISPLGVQQAQIANAFFASQFVNQKMTAPDSYYVSPLRRCLNTANITFANLTLPANKPFLPTIKEFFRENISIHTCDRRSNKTVIHSLYPTWPFEAGFSEEDLLWNGVTAETNSFEDSRSKKALDTVFSTDPGVYVSITTHSGEASSLLRDLGHIDFPLNTGAIIPILVKAVFFNETPPATSIQPFTPSAHCTVPPVTSISNGACVCPNSAAPVTTRLAGGGPFP